MNGRATLVVRGIVALVFLGGFGWVLYEFMHRDTELPKSVETALNVLLGAFTGSVTTIVAFYFGSSQSSADKTTELVKKP
jgi:hypothetical protein